MGMSSNLKVRKVLSSDKMVVGILLSLPFIFFLFLFIVPIGKALALSLRDYSIGYDTDEFIGLRNYLEIFGQKENIKHILRTFQYTGICVSLSFVIGLIWAMVVISIEDAFSKVLSDVLRQIIIIPMLMIPAATGVMWIFAYTDHYGWVNHILRALNLQSYPWLNSRGAFYLVMLTDIWAWSPFMFLILLAGLQTLPQEPIEAARIDGASRPVIFFRVILPMLRPIIFVSLTLKILDTYRAFDYLWIMTQGGPGSISTTLNIATYKTAFFSMNLGKASAFGITTLIFPLVIVNLYILAMRRNAGKEQ